MEEIADTQILDWLTRKTRHTSVSFTRSAMSIGRDPAVYFEGLPRDAIKAAIEKERDRD